MQLKKKVDQSVDASILHRKGNKIILGARRSEERGRERRGANKGIGTGIRRDRTEIQRIRMLTRNI